MTYQALPFVCTCILFILCYYTYAYEFVFNSLTNYYQKITYYIIFHILYCASIILCIAAVRDRGWEVPEKYKIPDKLFQQLLRAYLHEEDALLEDMCRERNITVHMRTKEGVKRVCYRCKHIKPDRAYHCRKCQECVCRMDHHCYYLNNCIGVSNIKYFIFLNAYVAIMNFFCVVTELEHIVRMVTTGQDVGFRISFIVVAAIVTFMVGVTCAILATITFVTLGKNSAMVEMKYKPLFEYETCVTYNKGFRKNMMENCGNNVLLWCLPCYFGKDDIVYELVEAQPKNFIFSPRTEKEYLEFEVLAKQPNVARRV